MKVRRAAFVSVILSWGFLTWAYSENASSSGATVSVTPFLGRWDLTLKAPDREYPSWLEIRQEGGQLRAQMGSRWGNARSLPKTDLLNGTVSFLSPKEEEDREN